MKEFPIEGSEDLKLVRKGRQNFAITNGEKEIIQLPRLIGRRIWLALFCEDKVGGNSGSMDDFDKPLRRRLKIFRSLSNCHGTAWELLIPHHEIRTNAWRIITTPETSIDPEKHNLLSMYYERMPINEAVRKYRYPIFSYRKKNQSIAHTILILGQNTDGKYIVFEKEGMGNMPFKISLRTYQELGCYEHCASYGKEDN